MKFWIGLGIGVALGVVVRSDTAMWAMDLILRAVQEKLDDKTRAADGAHPAPEEQPSAG